MRLSPAENAVFVLLRFCPAGGRPHTVGVLLLDLATDRLHIQMRSDWQAIASTDDAAILAEIAADLRKKAAAVGGHDLLEHLAGTLSHALQVTDPVRVQVSHFKTALRDLSNEHLK